MAKLRFALFNPGVLTAFILFSSILPSPAEAGHIIPFETSLRPGRENRIDEYVFEAMTAAGLQPPPLCSDGVFLRRAYLDIIGTIPEHGEVTEFLEDTRPDKRSLLVCSLMERQEFADYWSLKWGDILRLKSEFPINLWPNAVQAYHRWIAEALRENLPYDRFARELLTSSGSNFYTPQVNFYRAVPSREPAAMARAAALTFMGARTENWPEDVRAGFEALFSRIEFKGTSEWKEEIIYPGIECGGPLSAKYPDGSAVTIPAGADPRVFFCDWLLRPGNPWFSRNIVNRIWAWLMGRGIIHEPDDIRDCTPPSIPGLLDYLEGELAASGYDLRHIYRLILNSQAYQFSSIPANHAQNVEILFTHYPPRRLEAEVLIDIICFITGTGEEYISRVPEPFTFIPGHRRSILLEDGTITAPFLELFGRPPRDSGYETERNNATSEKQHLYLINSSDIYRRLRRSPKLTAIIREHRRDRKEIIRRIYILMLSRYPTPGEMETAEKYFETAGTGLRDAAADISWALLNSREFLFRH